MLLKTDKDIPYKELFESSRSKLENPEQRETKTGIELQHQIKKNTLPE